MHISCTFNMYMYTTYYSTFWFVPDLDYENHKEPKDLKTVSGYMNRVQYLETRHHSTLNITKLRESDSAEYRFMFDGYEVKWGSSLPGTILTVTGNAC